MSQKTQDILKQLEEGVQALFDSENYRKYLSFLSSFHAYSFRNSLLIFMQCQQRGITPTLCAPYRDWQKKHRHVKRGEKGIAIIAPHVYKAKKTGSDEDADRIGFHVTYTYDISQTEPDDDFGEVPEICHRLEGDLADEALLPFLADLCPVEVTFKPIDGEVNGYYDPIAKTITVDPATSQTQQAKTLLHEWAHAEHFDYDPYIKEETTSEDRELIAESTAYIVCRYLGIDSSDYSFGYLAAWSKSGSTKALKRHMDTIRLLADAMILKIEDAMNDTLDRHQ